jgi:hypothetical protein
MLPPKRFLKTCSLSTGGMQRQIFQFDKKEMRAGNCQVLLCTFATEETKSTLALYLNPREMFFNNYCISFKIKEGSLNVVDIESLLRVIADEAIIALGLDITLSPTQGSEE